MDMPHPYDVADSNLDLGTLIFHRYDSAQSFDWDPGNQGIVMGLTSKFGAPNPVGVMASRQRLAERTMSVD